jgi:hypothetical protein
LIKEARFALDSPVEGPGFEPSVPRLQVELGASGGARCDDAAPALAAPADIAVKVAEIRFPARGVGPGRGPAQADLCRDFFRRAVALELSFFEAAYAGRTDGGIRCGVTETYPTI